MLDFLIETINMLLSFLLFTLHFNDFILKFLVFEHEKFVLGIEF